MKEESNRKWIPLVMILTMSCGTIIVFLTAHFAFSIPLLKAIVATVAFMITGLLFAYLTFRNK